MGYPSYWILHNISLQVLVKLVEIDLLLSLLKSVICASSPRTFTSFFIQFSLLSTFALQSIPAVLAAIIVSCNYQGRSENFHSTTITTYGFFYSCHADLLLMFISVFRGPILVISVEQQQGLQAGQWGTSMHGEGVLTALEPPGWL
jgi:hypothetical protein